MSKARRLPSPDYQIPSAWVRVPELRQRIEQAVPVYMLNLVLVRLLTRGTPNARERAVFSVAHDCTVVATATPFRGLPAGMQAKGREIAIAVAKLALNRQVSDRTLPAMLATCSWVHPLLSLAPHMSFEANSSLSDAVAMVLDEIDSIARSEDAEGAYVQAIELGGQMVPVIEDRMSALGLYGFAAAHPIREAA
ncbi:hypothetical protein E6C67_08235 [Azospirillum sp. TSA2s]|uniref:hypothetical protein n=1 Tax=Azospirillum sp. TSA2s TaxID=709810 RepID=UPI0010AA57E3|nr:hypothetical protein [Azospirillum sp. TSA2s]QCG93928.1 hypothetical protein E6C67_08235 [Azospirillum sp. TSA2s]